MDFWLADVAGCFQVVTNVMYLVRNQCQGRAAGGVVVVPLKWPGSLLRPSRMPPSLLSPAYLSLSVLYFDGLWAQLEAS